MGEQKTRQKADEQREVLEKWMKRENNRSEPEVRKVRESKIKELKRNRWEEQRKQEKNTNDQAGGKEKLKGRQNAIEGKEVMNEKNESRGGESSTVKWKTGWDAGSWLYMKEKKLCRELRRWEKIIPFKSDLNKFSHFVYARISYF